MRVLGLSAFYHDSAAAIVVDGEVVAAAQEERFSRVKHDPSFPSAAIASCFDTAGVEPGGLDAVVYYDKPLDTFARIVRSFVAAGPRGLRAWPSAMREWTGRKLWVPYEVERGLRRLGHDLPGRLMFAEHHQSHAAAAFYPSPFDSACVLTFDGVGEWATSSIGHGTGRRLEMLEELRFPDSLGLLYSAFTVAAGFRVNSGEYKLMGLAPYGLPVYRDRILDQVLDLRADGSFTLDQRYFDYLAGRRMTSNAFDELFDGPPRDPASPITRRECDLARSIQDVLEEIVLRIARHGHALTGERRAVLAGGVALNCVANTRLLDDGPFDEIWVQPAAGDAGSAIGCALWAWHELLGHDRPHAGPADTMSGSRLGPSFAGDDVAASLAGADRPFTRLPDADERAERVAAILAEGGILGCFTGRMEFGPRALGNRSILADPRGRDTQRVLNRKIKRRESFRPFAPVVLAEKAAEWFELDHPSPYMLFVAPVRDAVPIVPDAGIEVHQPIDLGAIDVDSPLPAVTHVDGSARVQTVDPASAPELHRILSAFDAATGCPVLVNTSFNVRGEPIVGSPEDAYRCFMTTDIDWLLIEDCLLDKRDQPPWDGPPAILIDD